MRCYLCHAAALSSQLCFDCYRDLPWNQHACSRCATPLASTYDQICGQCINKPPAYDSANCPLLYRKPINPLMLRFKAGDEVCGRFLSLQFADLEPVTRAPLLYVPMHISALRQRGFNQSYYFAKTLSLQWQLEINDALICPVAHHSQKGLNAAQRRRNLANSFALKPGLKLPKTVNLVDDIMTTGATVEALSRLLKNHGVESVHVICLARTPPSGMVPAI